LNGVDCIACANDLEFGLVAPIDGLLAIDTPPVLTATLGLIDDGIPDRDKAVD
jgi:hypothetical protein